MSKKQKTNGKSMDSVPEELSAHIKSLEFNTVHEYKNWCKANKFSTDLNKSRKNLVKEMSFHKNQASIKKLAKYKKIKNPKSIIERMYRNKFEYSYNLDEATYEIYNSFNTKLDRQIIFKVFTHIESCSKLMKHSQYIRGITNSIKYFSKWKRPINDWRPKTHNVDRQFSSLLRHLFSDYKIPEFMDAVWMSNKIKRHRWFIHLGSGKNMRTAENLPITLTKKMAHYFLMTPNGYTVNAAFRWAQIIALGGNKRIADAIKETRIINSFRDENFWLGVIRFFIDNPMLDPVHINPIVDYIWNQRYVDRIVYIDRGIEENRGPSEPNFTMKGRTPDSLLRQVNAWHHQLGRENRGANLKWCKSKINDFEFAEGDKYNDNYKIWRLQELLNGQELISEGRALGHCVASYAQSCKSGKSGIWTMTCQQKSGVNKLLTIEVLLSNKQIWQVRGKHNRLATGQEKKIVQRWAQQEQLHYLTN